MGLPIWRDPEEKKASRSQAKPVPTACLRSSIRRRPSVHGRRTTRTRLPRDPTILPPRFERDPGPFVGFNGLRDSRRGDVRGVPPISSLLEAAERQRLSLPPPPAPEPSSLRASTMSRIAYGIQEQLQQHERTRERELTQREMRRHLTELHARNAELDRERDRIIQEATDAGVTGITAGSGRRSPLSNVSRNDRERPFNTIVITPDEPVRISRSSPESMGNLRAGEGPYIRRSVLPTPPLDTSGPGEESANTSFVAETEVDQPSESQTLRRAQPLHPLRHSWRASESLEPTDPRTSSQMQLNGRSWSDVVGGLGDRDRSLTPDDGWEVMRSTIAPDRTLPSQDSSFASAAASRSFNVSSNNMQSTDHTSVSSASRRDSSNDENANDSASSVEPEDLVCTDEDIYSTEAFAEDMYYHEMRTPPRRQRIAAHQRTRDRDGNRFALASEPARVDIGFRSTEEALESDDGRERVLHIRQGTTENVRNVEDMLAESRRSGRALRQLHADEAPTPRPDFYGEAAHDAANQTRRQFHGYLRRFAADSMPVDGPIIESPTSPPPDYEPLSSHPDVNTFTSRDGPEAHPVSPPSNRSEREVSEALLSGDVQDLDSMRRVVERLAARDDVPEEWWMSMGLNVSRARVRDRSPPTDSRLLLARQREMVESRSGRNERGNSRL